MTADINAAKERLTRTIDGVQALGLSLEWTQDVLALLAELSRLEGENAGLRNEVQEGAEFTAMMREQLTMAQDALAEANRRVAEQAEALRKITLVTVSKDIPVKDQARTCTAIARAALLSSEQKEEEASRGPGQRGCGSRDEPTAPATAALASGAKEMVRFTLHSGLNGVRIFKDDEPLEGPWSYHEIDAAELRMAELQFAAALSSQQGES